MNKKDGLKKESKEIGSLPSGMCRWRIIYEKEDFYLDSPTWKTAQLQAAAMLSTKLNRSVDPIGVDPKLMGSTDKYITGTKEWKK